VSGSGVYTRYPVRSVVLYNGVTLLHFGLAAAGLVVAYWRWPVLGWLLGAVYLVFAVVQMYLVMPIVVCPRCAYRTMSDALCVSGLNVLSARFKRPLTQEEFGRRAEGALCHNNLYMAALVGPLALMVPGMALGFSVAALALWLGVAALMAFRYLVVFKRTACPHCAVKGRCPNARSMGIA
jgi:hypothetical protein